MSKARKNHFIRLDWAMKLDVMNLCQQEQNAYDDYMHSLASYEHDYRANLPLLRSALGNCSGCEPV